MRFLVTKPSIQHIFWDNIYKVIEGKPQSKSWNWGQWHFEPSSWQRRRNSAHLGGFPWADTWSSAWQHELPALHSHLLYGCWQQKTTFFLTTSPEPFCDSGPMSRNQSAPRLQVFFPSLSRVLKAAAPELTSCVLGMIWRVPSNINDSVIPSGGMWLCSSFRLSQLITFPGLLCAEVRETFPK